MATERWEVRDDGDDGIPYVKQVEPEVMGDIVCVAPTEYLLSMAGWAKRAPLLAASPDLLAALIRIVETGFSVQAEDQARAAITKATAAPGLAGPQGGD